MYSRTNKIERNNKWEKKEIEKRNEESKRIKEWNEITNKKIINGCTLIACISLSNREYILQYRRKTLHRTYKKSQDLCYDINTNKSKKVKSIKCLRLFDRFQLSDA